MRAAGSHEVHAGSDGGERFVRDLVAVRDEVMMSDRDDVAAEGAWGDTAIVG